MQVSVLVSGTSFTSNNKNKYMKNKLTVRELREMLFNVKNQDAIVMSVTTDGWCENVVSEITSIEEIDGKVFLRDKYTSK